MTIKALLEKHKQYSSITIEEQKNGTFKATTFSRKDNKVKTYKYKSLTDCKDYSHVEYIDSINGKFLYSAINRFSIDDIGKPSKTRK